MSILRSFNIGLSGLHAAGGGMAVISDNIANAGTNGFKGSRAEFQDILSRALNSIDSGNQVGSGAQLATTTTLFTQGSVIRTDKVTDLSINGNGFFELTTPSGFGYTRDGTFHFDKEGYLVNENGYRVNAFLANNVDKITNKKGPLRLGNTTIPARATRKMEFNMNIDSREEILAFDADRPEETSSYNNTIIVYDNLGIARLLTVFFNKTDDNSWEYHVGSDGEDIPGGTKGEWVEQASGALVFNDQGVLQEERVDDDSFDFSRGAASDQRIRFSFGTSLAEGGNGLDASTQYGVSSTIARHYQDGYSAAQLASVSFNDRGILVAAYDNGIPRNVGQVGLAKFEDNQGLVKTGKNIFKASISSGTAVFGAPEDGGRGEIVPKSVELSNVDIATEFVNLMTAQRNFQANARTITTSDQMLQEVIGLKR